MKYFTPGAMKPNINQFYDLTRDKISAEGQQSPAYLTVANLFSQATTLYKTLSSSTAHNLAYFKDGKYLTQLQEHDSVALTVIYVWNLKTDYIDRIVKQDTTIDDQERLVLELALEVYRTCCESNYGVIGNPRWIEE